MILRDHALLAVALSRIPATESEIRKQIEDRLNRSTPATNDFLTWHHRKNNPLGHSLMKSLVQYLQLHPGRTIPLILELLT